MKYDLMCRFDSANSFCGKAYVEIEEDNIVKTYKLYSYNTLVAIYSEDKLSNLKLYDYLGKFSNTTTRHQKEFFRQFGLYDSDIKELFEKGHLEV